MIDVTHKVHTLRKAIASAIVRTGSKDTLNAIREGKVPKGNVLEAARIAGLFAVKRTAEMIPDCHPMPVEFTQINYRLSENEVHIEVEVHTVYKTGVEVEAMHGASVVALTIYDMLKPIDKAVEISSIKLVSKSGGKSDFTDKYRKDLKAAVVVCSDSVSAGKKKDSAGKEIITKLENHKIEISEYSVILDDIDRIQEKLNDLYLAGNDMIIFTGGTGLSDRDTTPEAIRPFLEREVPGIMEAARNYGQDRTPYSMLSRSIAGMKGKTLIMAVPGSTKGAKETMDALFPAVLHIFRVVEGARHD